MSNNGIINKQTKKTSRVIGAQTAELSVETTTQRYTQNTVFRVRPQSYSAHHHARRNSDATIHTEYGVQSQTSDRVNQHNNRNPHFIICTQHHAFRIRELKSNQHNYERTPC
jgi:hypothetical protein